MNRTYERTLEAKVIYNGKIFTNEACARWAAFFDQLGIRYQTNPNCRVELKGGGFYQFDFWLSDLQRYIHIDEPRYDAHGEIINEWFPDTKNSGDYGEYDEYPPCFAIAGTPGDPDIWGFTSPTKPRPYCGFITHDTYYYWCECPHCGALGMQFEGRSARNHHKNGCPTINTEDDKNYNTDSPRLLIAYATAKSAHITHITTDLLCARPFKPIKKTTATRLYDRLVAAAGRNTPVRGAVVVSADNIAEYVERYGGTEWDSYPNYGVPFDRTFIEVQRSAPPYRAWGINLWSVEDERAILIKGSLVYERENGDLQSGIGITIETDKKHQLIGCSLHLIGDDPEREFTYFNLKTQKWELKDRHIALAKRLLKPLFMALALMSCTNVQLIDEFPLSSLSQIHEKKYREPLVKFKTVRIRPNRISKSGREKQEPAKHLDLPLTVHHGHFKVFTPERPLFGKYTGTFWWHQHVRGSAKNGINIKDYVVQQPYKEGV